MRIKSCNLSWRWKCFSGKILPVITWEIDILAWREGESTGGSGESSRDNDVSLTVNCKEGGESEKLMSHIAPGAGYWRLQARVA